MYYYFTPMKIKSKYKYHKVQCTILGGNVYLFKSYHAYLSKMTHLPLVNLEDNYL